MEKPFLSTSDVWKSFHKDLDTKKMVNSVRVVTSVNIKVDDFDLEACFSYNVGGELAFTPILSPMILIGVFAVLIVFSTTVLGYRFTRR